MPASWPLRVSGFGQDLEEGGWKSLDASSDGLGVELQGPLERGTVLKLDFTPGSRPAIGAYAVVDSEGPQGRADLRFIGISEEAQQRLETLVQRFAHGDDRLRNPSTGLPTYRSRLLLRALFAQ
jgi:hypothetical protein